jgi:hypothetical protein
MSYLCAVQPRDLEPPPTANLDLGSQTQTSVVRLPDSVLLYVLIEP